MVVPYWGVLRGGPAMVLAAARLFQGLEAGSV